MKDIAMVPSRRAKRIGVSLVLDMTRGEECRRVVGWNRFFLLLNSEATLISRRQQHIVNGVVMSCPLCDI